MDISAATTLASGLVGLIVPAVVQAFKKYIPGEYVGLVSLAASILFCTIAIAATGGFDGTYTWDITLAGVVGVAQTVYTLVNQAFDGKLSKIRCSSHCTRWIRSSALFFSHRNWLRNRASFLFRFAALPPCLFTMERMKLLDNVGPNRLGEALKHVIDRGASMSIIASYFTIFAYGQMRDVLADVNELRFIFSEPTFVKRMADAKEPKEFALSQRSRERGVGGADLELTLRNNLSQRALAHECAEWLRWHASFKSAKASNRMQTGSVYCVENGERAQAFSGMNVPFTLEGLGYERKPGVVSPITHFEDTGEAQPQLMFFNQLWDTPGLLEEVTDQVIEQVKTLYREDAPEYIYFLTLFHMFRDFLEESEEDPIKPGLNFEDTEVWNRLYDFQKDGVVGAIRKLEKYKGYIIADSVGLGKTFEALAIIKYYELRNDRVLVLAPKRLRENWTMYKGNDTRNILANDRFNYDVLNHTDLSRRAGMSGDINLETLNWSNYDLVVIDESHNFRNRPTDTTTESRYYRLINDIVKKGVRGQIEQVIAHKAEKLQIKDKAEKVEVGFNERAAQNEAFRELWRRIRPRTKFELHVDSDTLVTESISYIQGMEKIRPIEIHSYRAGLDIDEAGISVGDEHMSVVGTSRNAQYDLPDPIAELQGVVGLTRHTLKRILEGCGRSEEFKVDPVTFITQVAACIQKAKRKVLPKGITYTMLPEAEWYKTSVLSPQGMKGYRGQNAFQPSHLEKWLYDYVAYDSTTVERPFARQLDRADDVLFCAKLPDSFVIDTPFGSYNPDWAYVEDEENGEQRVYFVVETKGGKNGIANTRPEEQSKIDCAKIHFAELAKEFPGLEYEVGTKYDKVME